MGTTEDPILSIQNLDELLRFGGSVATRQLADTHGTLTQVGVSHILKLCKALWIHSGNPSDPHAELTSGKCSNGFADVLRALRYTNICDLLAYHMAEAIDRSVDPHADWVIGSDHAGAVFSQNVGRWLGTQHDFTEKSGPNGKEQAWKRFTIQPNETVLQVEELTTTSQTLMAVREGVRKGNAHPVTFAPVVGVLVHRSEVYEIEGAPVVYLAHYDIAVWTPEFCPLCKAGSKRLRPKENWAELTGQK